MKIIISLLFLVTSHFLVAQTVAGSNDIEELNLFYCDTVNDEIAYGDYEPKDLKQLDDGSLIIGTELSISFSTRFQSPVTYDSAYFARRKMFDQKSHTSSGTVFKLSPNFEKDWETIFNEQRVERVLITSDNRILVVGEEVSMRFVWVAELDTDGKVKWERHYSYKNHVTIADAILDENDDVYLLLEASHRAPVQIVNHYGEKRIEFYRDSDINSHLALLKTSSYGHKKWLKTLDKRKDYEKFGYRLIANQGAIYASYSYSGFEENQKIEGKTVVGHTISGKKTFVRDIPETQNLLLFDNELITMTAYSKGTLSTYKSGNEINTTEIKSPDNDVRIEKMIPKSDGYLLFGSNHDNNRDYLLINLNSDFTFGTYWTHPRHEYNDIRGAEILPNGEMIIVGKCYSSEMGGPGLTSYVNLIRIKNGF